MVTGVDGPTRKEEIVTLMDKYKVPSEETEYATSSKSGFNYVNQYGTDDSNMIPNKPGACLPEEKCEIETQKESYNEASDISNVLHTSCDKPTSDEISTQLVNFNDDISLTQRKDDITGTSELVEEGEILFIKKKRLKITEPSEPTTLNSDINMEEANSSLLDLPHTTPNTSLDQPIELESVSPCFSGRMSEKTEIAVDGISLEVIENTSKCPILSSGDALDRNKAFDGCKKLLVLDVNGLLVDISPYVPYDYDPDEILLKKAIFRRPYCDDFLKFCFERFNVGVWSSRTKTNIEPILDFLFGNEKAKLLFRWDQSHCTYTGFTTVEKRDKPLLLKKLKKLWDKYEQDLPWDKGVFNESNTLLIDDSPYKAICNPRHTAIFPYTYRFRNVRDNSLGPGGELRVYLEGLAMAENVQEYVKQNPFGQRPITEKNLSWGFYLKVIEAASSSPPRYE
ncbi:hypothetical protein ACJIZ3_020762 [Penstemon smallii]|uniref:Mitochondrial import inner membrane translocase subunit TIM50 n=1 Tax=Penstemon smallii TaxID=265156 RepID=A0ABD3SK58_9LAMI